MPPDWRPIEWEAFIMLHDGATYRETAEASGVQAGTVGQWVRKWRKKYGPEVFISPNPQHPEFTDEQRSRGGQTAGAIQQLKYAELRADMARSAGVTGDNARGTALKMIAVWLDDEQRIKQADTTDILNLARAFEIFTKRADLLADIPSADRPHASGLTQTNTDIKVNVDLSKLEQAAEGEEIQETMRAVDDVLKIFKTARGDVIEAEATEKAS